MTTVALPTSPVDEALDDGDDPKIVFKRRVEDAEMDMTPMVDIVFQLLIFFMVTASFSTQKSMEVPKPKDDRPSPTAIPEEDPPVALTIIVEPSGSFRIESDDGGDEEAPSEQELIVKLTQHKRTAAADGSNMSVLVKANGEAPHFRVVMAIDAAASAGFGKVGLQTIEDNE